MADATELLDQDRLMERLVDAVGSEAVHRRLEGMATEELPVQAVAEPASAEQVAETVRAAGSGGWAVYPVGGGTALRLGLPGTKPGAAVRLNRLDQVVDYPARDMTITVQAGMSVARLQRLLAAERQRLPVDVPVADRATVGGAVACNLSGPRRYAYGTLRDYVIGISVVDAAGRQTKAGGRVVKNVAGYDLCKLYTGSLGTLGVITQVSFKVRPLAECHGLAWIKLESLGGLSAALDRLSVSGTRPACLEVLNSTAAEHVAAAVDPALPVRPWVLVIGFEATEPAVAWQRDRLRAELDGIDHWMQWFGEAEADALWQGLVGFQALEPGPLSFKASFPSSGTAEFLDLAQRQPVQWAVQVHAGNGIAYGHAASGDDRQTVITSVERLRALAADCGGHLTVRQCPTPWKTTALVWGQPSNDLWLMRAIKQALDPDGILNPGRFVGGI